MGHNATVGFQLSCIAQAERECGHRGSAIRTSSSQLSGPPLPTPRSATNLQAITCSSARRRACGCQCGPRRRRTARPCLASAAPWRVSDRNRIRSCQARGTKAFPGATDAAKHKVIETTGGCTTSTFSDQAALFSDALSDRIFRKTLRPRDRSRYCRSTRASSSLTHLEASSWRVSRALAA